MEVHTSDRFLPSSGASLTGSSGFEGDGGSEGGNSSWSDEGKVAKVARLGQLLVDENARLQLENERLREEMNKSAEWRSEMLGTPRTSVSGGAHSSSQSRWTPRLAGDPQETPRLDRWTPRLSDPSRSESRTPRALGPIEERLMRRQSVSVEEYQHLSELGDKYAERQVNMDSRDLNALSAVAAADEEIEDLTHANEELMATVAQLREDLDRERARALKFEVDLTEAMRLQEEAQRTIQQHRSARARGSSSRASSESSLSSVRHESPPRTPGSASTPARSTPGRSRGTIVDTAWRRDQRLRSTAELEVELHRTRAEVAAAARAREEAAHEVTESRKREAIAWKQASAIVQRVRNEPFSPFSAECPDSLSEDSEPPAPPPPVIPVAATELVAIVLEGDISSGELSIALGRGLAGAPQRLRARAVAAPFGRLRFEAVAAHQAVHVAELRLCGPLDEHEAWLRHHMDRARVAGFDPARPLWDATLVRGYEQDRCAVILRCHPLLLDGAPITEVATGLLDGRDFLREFLLLMAAVVQVILGLGAALCIAGRLAYDARAVLYPSRWRAALAPLDEASCHDEEPGACSDSELLAATAGALCAVQVARGEALHDVPCVVPLSVRGPLGSVATSHVVVALPVAHSHQDRRAAAAERLVAARRSPEAPLRLLVRRCLPAALARRLPRPEILVAAGWELRGLRVAATIGALPARLVVSTDSRNRLRVASADDGVSASDFLDTISKEVAAHRDPPPPTWSEIAAAAAAATAGPRPQKPVPPVPRIRGMPAAAG